MQILPLAITALALSRHASSQSSAPCKLNITEDQLADAGPPWHLGLPFMPGPKKTFDIEARAATGYGNLNTRWNKCVDVKDGKFAAGQAPQIWDCSTASANQQWKMAGNLLRTANGMCLDVPWGWAYPGAPVQLWNCDAANKNQWFEVAGSSIRKKNTNFCLDVRDGHYDNGGALQLFSCDWNGNGNQVMSFNKPVTQASGSPSAFLGYAAISIEKFGQLHPECAPWVAHFKNAAASTGLHPTLVAAVAENESTCRERPNNGFGIMQFMDEASFQRFGGGDKQKAGDAIWAGARYLRYLLDDSNQNLDAALRKYNGPTAQGGDPDYQKNIRTWMSGGSTW